MNIMAKLNDYDLAIVDHALDLLNYAINTNTHPELQRGIKRKGEKIESHQKKVKIPPKIQIETDDHENLRQLYNSDGIITNDEPFVCVLCTFKIGPGEGIILRECLHSVCVICMNLVVQDSLDAMVKCPYLIDDNRPCEIPLQDNEIAAISSNFDGNSLVQETPNRNHGIKNDCGVVTCASGLQHDKGKQFDLSLRDALHTQSKVVVEKEYFYNQPSTSSASLINYDFIQKNPQPGSSRLLKSAVEVINLVSDDSDNDDDTAITFSGKSNQPSTSSINYDFIQKYPQPGTGRKRQSTFEAIKLTSDDSDKDDDTPGNFSQSAFEKRHYFELLALDFSKGLIANTTAFECGICFMEIQPQQGCVLRDCLHTFCRQCLSQTIKFSEEAIVKCPYVDDSYTCESSVQDREIKALLTEDEHERHLAKLLRLAESSISNTFHCRMPNCTGWCICEDDVNQFLCPKCNSTNCLSCQVCHVSFLDQSTNYLS